MYFCDRVRPGFFFRPPRGCSPQKSGCISQKKIPKTQASPFLAFTTLPPFLGLWPGTGPEPPTLPPRGSSDLNRSVVRATILGPNFKQFFYLGLKLGLTLDPTNFRPKMLYQNSRLNCDPKIPPHLTCGTPWAYIRLRCFDFSSVTQDSPNKFRNPEEGYVWATASPRQSALSWQRSE